MLRKIQNRGRGRVVAVTPEVLKHLEVVQGDMLKFELLEDGSVKMSKAAAEEVERG